MSLLPVFVAYNAVLCLNKFYPDAERQCIKSKDQEFKLPFTLEWLLIMMTLVWGRRKALQS